MLLFLSVISFLISFLITSVIKRYSSQRLLDIPNQRSSHTQPTPRGGGLGFILGFAIVVSGTLLLREEYLTHSFQLQDLKPYLFCLCLVWLPLGTIGFIDDYRNVPAAVRYIVQFLCAAIAVKFFGAFPQSWLIHWGTLGGLIAISLTLIGITALINFYNFMDGLDGLVAGVSAVQFGFLAIYLNQNILWLLVGAILGFFCWNWSPAKIFMGDVGSTTLGATVAITLLNTHQNALQSYSALAITFPLIGDAIYTLIRRLLKKENIFQAHRSHIYQRLQQSGWSHEQVAVSYMGLTLLAAISIIRFEQIGIWLSLVSSIFALCLAQWYLSNRYTSETSKVKN